MIDLAIVRAPFRSEEFSCVFLEEEPMVAVGDESYFSKMPWDSATLADLEGLPLICYRRWESLIRATFEEEGIVPYIYCLNDDARTSLMWASAGLGVAIVPVPSVRSSHEKELLIKDSGKRECIHGWRQFAKRVDTVLR